MALREASWKGVSFFVDQSSGEFGRRAVLHEYPARDLPESEDLGRAPRKVSITAFFIGDDAWEKAQTLIAAMERAGPGALVHPWLGYWEKAALVNPGKVNWPRAGGGRVSVDLELIQEGDAPEPETDHSGALQEAVDALRDENNDNMATEWPEETDDWLTAAAKQVQSALKDFEKLMDAADKAISVVEGTITTVQSIINAPLQVISAIQSRVSKIRGIAANPFSGVTAWKKLLSGAALNAWNPSGGTITINSTPAWVTAGSKNGSGTVTANNSGGSSEVLPPLPVSLAHWLRREIILQGIEALPGINWTSQDELDEARTLLADLLAVEMKVCTSPALFNTLSDLRVAVAAHFAGVAPTLPQIITITTQADLPAVVLAYRANGDLDQLDDLIARNGVRHPGFVPAGDVKVLAS